MEGANISTIEKQAVYLGSKSWTAYVFPFVVGLILTAITAGMASTYSAPVVIAISAVWIAILAYRMMMLNSYRLYYDGVGVWVSSGVLPWQKGVSGVKWRDLDEAVYFKSFGSWLFDSYGIRIGHRFTKSSEILLTSWAEGKVAVERINAKHHELVSGEKI